MIKKILYFLLACTCLILLVSLPAVLVYAAYTNWGVLGIIPAVLIVLGINYWVFFTDPVED